MTPTTTRCRYNCNAAPSSSRWQAASKQIQIMEVNARTLFNERQYLNLFKLLPAALPLLSYSGPFLCYRTVGATATLGELYSCVSWIIARRKLCVF
eukprot:COSAG06_NODE_6604_length_2858_cov_2.063429_2_plen_96_part_00